MNVADQLRSCLNVQQSKTLKEKAAVLFMGLCKLCVTGHSRLLYKGSVTFQTVALLWLLIGQLNVLRWLVCHC